MVTINGKPLTMDTGVAVSIISIHTRKTLLPGLTQRQFSITLKTYTEKPMEVVGQLHMRVKYGSQEKKLVLVVVAGNGPTLFGQNWLKYLRLDWGKIASIQTSRSELLDALLK